MRSLLSTHPDSEQIVVAAFEVIANHVSAGEIYRIKQTLPFSTANLWPSKEYNEEQETAKQNKTAC